MLLHGHFFWQTKKNTNFVSNTPKIHLLLHISMKRKQQTSLLWSIRREGSPHVSYLFGTIHVWDEKFEPIVAFAKKHLLECDYYAGETNLDEMKEIGVENFYLTENQQLTDLYSPAKFKRMSHIFEKVVGTPLSAYNDFTPFMVTSTILNSLSETPESSVDSILWDFAKSQHLTTFGLESLTEQVGYFKNISIAEQSKSLKGILENPTRYRKQYKLMTAAYAKMDIVMMYKKSKSSFKNSRKMMIYERNEIMSQRIADFAERHSIFVAVGSGHMTGQYGILRKLKHMGFVVEEIGIKN